MPSAAMRVDPLLGFSFAISFPQLAILAGFSECTGLQAETELNRYREGGRNTNMRLFVTGTSYGPITLRRGIGGRELWDWYAGIVGGRKLIRYDGQIHVVEPGTGTFQATWEVTAAFPTSWRGPELNASQSAVAVESFELSHDGLSRKR